MAAVVSEAFLSAFIEVVMGRLVSPEFSNFIRGKKLDDNLLQRLKNTLYAVEAVLNDAEQKQIKYPAVNKWLDDLKDAVYVADDFLDHVSTKAATRKEEVSNFFSRYFNFQDRDMVNKLEDIVGRLESIFKLKDILGLKEVAKENYSWRLPSTSLEDGSNIYGRDQDKKAILKLLLDCDMSDGKVGVIPIVGMGGVGKTTLAQLVYNDENLKQEFDLRAWVCVSDEFDIVKVTKTITQAITKRKCGVNDINLLHLELKEMLMGRKFLIVLDDVWMEDYVTWNFLIKPLQFGNKGSKILVTTRIAKVASLIQTSQGYHLKQLLDEDCWSVFANHACFSSASNGNTTLERIGRHIVKKCDGLPLAAQSLGGLLRGKHDIRDWNNILNCNIWELSENESKIIPALRISYHYLPPCLKRCFVYCSLYPKDYEFKKDELILLWMAEDLLPPSKSGKTLEEVGCEYFDDLVSRSFFQPSTVYMEGYFVMHDLVHDLAILLGGEFYFRSEELGEETKICMKTRHLSLSGFSEQVSENSDFFGRVKFLRTLLPIDFKESPFNNGKAACAIMSNLKYLRVLSFRRFGDVEAFLDSIGELIHMRYLDLSYTRITTLPESLCNLYNLQTLKLFHCSLLTMLPEGMQNLVNLRHLDIRDTKIKEMPKGMSGLKNLQYLSKFIVGEHEGQKIKELGKFSNFHGSLRIRNLQNVANGNEALEAKVTDKKNLDTLSLYWSRESHFADSLTEMGILDKLQPHQDLKSICISGYRGTKFPEWVGHSSYHNMTSIFLRDCTNCCMLPSLGELPYLMRLDIGGLTGLEIVGVEFLKSDNSFSGTPFPSLQSLRFYDMPCWEVWHPFESNAFPQLNRLLITNCPRLRGELPNNLPALVSLGISSCEQLSSSLPRAPVLRCLVIKESNKVSLRVLPLSVEGLQIDGSEVLESMFEAITITQPTSLQRLDIKNCSSARSFPGDCLPASLKKLHISGFRKLEFPKQQHELLELLVIERSCDSLTSLPLESFPNLHSLTIKNLENLESLSVRDAALTEFFIEGCPKFVSFPREGLSALGMTKFFVSNCDKLELLPCHMSTLLPKLESLKINNCLEIESLPRMPPSLRSLVIGNCEKLMRSPSLASVDMLTHLTIEGPCDGVKSFPEKGLVLLPPSLTSLELYNLATMETLECKGLLHLTSLQQLTIAKCPKLENVTGERMPASIIKLQITECPLLEERCKMKHPEIWPKVSHIRGITIKDRWIP